MDPDLIRIRGFITEFFSPSWIRIRIPNTDPDPMTWLNPGPIRIRNPGYYDTGTYLTSDSIRYIFNSNKNANWPVRRFPLTGVPVHNFQIFHTSFYFLQTFHMAKWAVLRIRDVYPGSWFLPIPDPGSKNSNKTEGWKICFLPFL
jgi:hypothetical protein